MFFQNIKDFILKNKKTMLFLFILIVALFPEIGFAKEPATSTDANDSEILALDFLDAISTGREQLYSRGTIAIVAYDLNSDKLFLYRNEGNPLEYYRDRDLVIIASNAVGGKKMKTDTLMTFDSESLILSDVRKMTSSTNWGNYPSYTPSKRRNYSSYPKRSKSVKSNWCDHKVVAYAGATHAFQCIKCKRSKNNIKLEKGSNKYKAWVKATGGFASEEDNLPRESKEQSVQLALLDRITDSVPCDINGGWCKHDFCTADFCVKMIPLYGEDFLNSPSYAKHMDKLEEAMPKHGIKSALVKKVEVVDKEKDRMTIHLAYGQIKELMPMMSMFHIKNINNLENYLVFADTFRQITDAYVVTSDLHERTLGRFAFQRRKAIVELWSYFDTIDKIVSPRFQGTPDEENEGRPFADLLMEAVRVV